MNILLGVTGSVATTLTLKMVKALQQLGNVKIVTTEKARYFLKMHEIEDSEDGGWVPGPDYELASLIHDDNDEWWKGGDQPVWTKKGDPVVHIDLRKWAGICVVAPCTANTMAKFVNGISDNLLTSIYRAWDWTRPVVIAPSMNVSMWQNPPTAEHISLLKDRGAKIIMPQSKMLACNDIGMGAMAEIEEIIHIVKNSF